MPSGLTASVWAAAVCVVVVEESETEVCATSRLAVLNVDTMAKVSAGATGFGAGSLAVDFLPVLSARTLTVCALTVDFGDDVSASRSASDVGFPSAGDDGS